MMRAKKKKKKKGKKEMKKPQKCSSLTNGANERDIMRCRNIIERAKDRQRHRQHMS
jgi:hypothetical protein